MSTDTNIKTLIFNKLTQEQYNNADKVPTEFYLTPDTSIDSSEKGEANGVASLDTNAKVPTEQIPVATTSALGGVKPDGNTITVTEDGTISATGGSGSGSGFDFEGTKAEFDAAVAAGTITEDSVSLITDDVSGDNVATKAELQAVDSSKADTALSNVLANIDYVVEFQVNAEGSWYRKYKSGWLEQGGISTSKTVTFLKTFANTNYTLTTACEYGSGDANNNIHVEYANNGKTTTGFSWAISIGQYVKSINWEAKGMGAN